MWTICNLTISPYALIARILLIEGAVLDADQTQICYVQNSVKKFTLSYSHVDSFILVWREYALWLTEEEVHFSPS